MRTCTPEDAPTRGRGRPTVILLVIAVLVAAGAAGWPGTSAALPAPSADPFYRYDKPLDGVKPGTVLRTRPVTYGYRGALAPVSSTQVLYRSTDQHGAPVAAVATVLRSPVAGPAKLLSFHMAYDALGPQCDPSYTLTGAGVPGPLGTLEQGVMSGYLASGYDIVVPDYEGRDQEWTIGRQSAYAALDGVRAAQRVLKMPRSVPVGLLGYSGGSVPTQWGAEVAPDYAPELNVVGAAAGGLPVHLAHNLPYVSGSKSWAGVIPALVVAYSRTYRFDTAAFLSARGKQIVRTVSSQCINTFAAQYPGLTNRDMVRAPYTSLLQVAPVARAINDNIMGSAGTPDTPVLLGVGQVDAVGDGLMVTGDVEGLAHKYCRSGAAVTYARYAGQAHGPAFIPFQAQAAQFLTDRFAGARPSSNCSVVGRGNSLAPVPVP